MSWRLLMKLLPSPCMRFLPLLELAFVATLVGLLATTPSIAKDAPVAVIQEGRVSGLVSDGVRQFLGIPYALPPVGKLRWRAPRPAGHWSGILLARKFGPSCAQPAAYGVFSTPSAAEDCLTINVFVPEGRNRAPLPVMVWIYGGGHFAGASSDYDAAALARDGKVMVVTFNYRLGVLGFFSHPAVDAPGEEGVNYGLLDQRLALTWVRRNAAAFGGDPHSTTVFGQSAGGSSILAGLAIPGFATLFERAIVQSGARLSGMGLRAAREHSAALANDLGCGEEIAECLRSQSAAAIVARQGPFLTGPIQDGRVLTHTAADALAMGLLHAKPLLIGMTKDEQAFSLAAREMEKGPQSQSGYREDIERYYGAGNVEQVFTKYSPNPSPSEAEIRAWRDSRACTMRWIAHTAGKSAPVYVYQFDDRSVPSYYPTMSFPTGAYHTAEILYLFPGFHGGSTQPTSLSTKQKALAKKIRQIWGAFARSGNPEIESIPEWPRFSQREAVLHLDQQIEVSSDYGQKSECDFWDTVNAY